MQIYLTDFSAGVCGGSWTEAFRRASDVLRAAGGGRLCVPSGTYLTGPIRLYSNMELHLEAGAVLRFLDREDAYPLRKCLYEGKLADRPSPCIGAYQAENVSITGFGVLDGQGSAWWEKARNKTLLNGRPYLLHFEDCTRLTLRDIRLQNSPAWTVHPLRCQDVRIEGISICNPYDALNTDGINPESCRNVRISNCCVDVGDDCITLKSGTEETRTPPPCENITITNCCLVHGHGGIVIGSEMSGGVRNVTVSNCVFTGTDRGLRIKTRRRRGGTVENVTLDNLVMERVFCPFVFNMYYSCGTEEKDRWVWDKAPYPVDGGTPAYRDLTIRNVTVVDAAASAGFFYGLAESPITGLQMTDCTIRMAAGAAPQTPAMMGGLAPMRAKGLFLRNAKDVRLRNVRVCGADGAVLDIDETVQELRQEDVG